MQGSASADSLLWQDMHAPHDLLPQLASHLHWQGEIILLNTNWGMLDLVANLIATLREFGHQHVLLLVDNQALAEHAKAHGRLPCVWSSMLDKYTRAAPILGDNRCPGTCESNFPEQLAFNRASVIQGRRQPRMNASCRRALEMYCEPSAMSFYRCDSVRRMWLLRYHYTARLIRLGYNVLLLDADTAILADPYPYLRSSFAEYQALCAHDHTAWPQMKVNGGTWYVHNAQVGGPVHRLFEDFSERMISLLEAYPAVKRYDMWQPSGAKALRPAQFLLFDQVLINSVLLDAVTGRKHALNSTEKDVQLSAVEARRASWQMSCCFATPQLFIPASTRGRSVLQPRAVDAGAVADGAAEINLRPMDAPYSLRYLKLRDLSDCAATGVSKATAARVSPAKPAGHGRSRCASRAPERVAKMPAWLLSSEADSPMPSASAWGERPPSAAMVHFVCSAWPGSDGRRAALRLWGLWRQADVDAVMGEHVAKLQQERTHRFVAFSSLVPALSPAELTPYLRLISLLGLISGRTPVLPLMPCGPPATAQAGPSRKTTQISSWAWPALDANGEPIRIGEGRRRPCGWVLHRIGARRLPRPLCVQRPLEGCFHAFALPTELEHARLPADFWNQTLSDSPTEASSDQSMSLADAAAILRLGVKMRSDATQVATVPVLAQQVSSVRALQDAHEFLRVQRKALRGSPRRSALLAEAWSKCQRMLVNNMCAATC